MNNWRAKFGMMWESSRGGIINPKYLESFIAEVVDDQKKSILKRVKFLKRPELDNAALQLLSRHEREEYNRATIGYNEGIDDVIETLEP